MTTSAVPSPSTINVLTADDVATLWEALMGGGGFSRRTLWLGVLDDSGRPTPVLMPIDDIPPVPTESDVNALETVVAALVEIGTVIMLISRPGPEAVHEHDRSWARALSPLAPTWPLHLATACRSDRCTVRVIDSGPVVNAA